MAPDHLLSACRRALGPAPVLWGGRDLGVLQPGNGGPQIGGVKDGSDPELATPTWSAAMNSGLPPWAQAACGSRAVTAAG